MTKILKLIKNQKKTLFLSLAVAGLSIALAFGIGLVFAEDPWDEPAYNPPTCPSGDPGCDAPINTGPTYQKKEGNLRVDDLYGDDIKLGNWPENQISSGGNIALRNASGVDTINIDGDNGALVIGTGGAGYIYLGDQDYYIKGSNDMRTNAPNFYVDVDSGSPKRLCREGDEACGGGGVDLQGWSFENDIFKDDNQEVIRANDTWLRLNQAGNFTSGVHTPGLFAPGALSVNIWSNPGAGNINYSGQLMKLDVADNFGATVRAADFNIGYSGRRGSPGRAIVDLGGDLRFNYGNDWSVASVGSGLNVYGNLAVNGKITANEIDPIYNIDGTKYATYGHSTVGLKEEMVGKARLEDGRWKMEDGSYGYVIDFGEQEEESDLWLFKKITDFGKDWEDLVVSLTPEGRTQVWYELNPGENKVIIYGDEPVTVSYRLIAPRFDWPKRNTNLAPSQDVEGMEVK